jgi:hypothetical protein
MALNTVMLNVNAECHYAGCLYAECRGAVFNVGSSINSFSLDKIGFLIPLVGNLGSNAKKLFNVCG